MAYLILEKDPHLIALKNWSLDRDVKKKERDILDVMLNNEPQDRNTFIFKKLVV